ncbi:MAG: DNA repair protein RadA, partial [Clostridia bacterium]|nr:DNA repair protein RadA [Clostridia bacterium]
GDLAAIGEVGLTGELRSVGQLTQRISEVHRLGFKRCILPYNNCKNLQEGIDGIEIIGVKSVREAYNRIAENF